MNREFVLPDVGSGLRTVHSKVLANGWPHALLPREEVLFNAGRICAVLHM